VPNIALYLTALTAGAVKVPPQASPASQARLSLGVSSVWKQMYLFFGLFG
jgi:hypothetical protein